MKCYLASMYTMREQLKQYAKELEKEGIGVTSRWLKESLDPHVSLTEAKAEMGEQWLSETANNDLWDVASANVTVLFTVPPEQATVRGGRHFEAGFTYCLQRMMKKKNRLVTVGPRENIFHWLPDVLNFETWEAAKAWLIEHRAARAPKAVQLPLLPFMAITENLGAEQRCK